MSRRIEYRGPNRWQSNGRTPGHGLPMAQEPAALGVTTRMAIGISIFCALYFLVQFVRPLLRTQGWPV